MASLQESLALEQALAAGDVEAAEMLARQHFPQAVPLLVSDPGRALGLLRAVLQQQGVDVPQQGSLFPPPPSPGQGLLEQFGAGMQEGLPGLFATPLALPGAAAPGGLAQGAARLAGGTLPLLAGTLAAPMAARFVGARMASPLLARLAGAGAGGAVDTGIVAAGQQAQAHELNPQALALTAALAGPAGALAAGVGRRGAVGAIRGRAAQEVGETVQSLGRGAAARQTFQQGLEPGATPARQLLEVSGPSGTRVIRPPAGLGRVEAALGGAGPRRVAGPRAAQVEQRLGELEQEAVTRARQPPAAGSARIQIEQVAEPGVVGEELTSLTGAVQQRAPIAQDIADQLAEQKLIQARTATERGFLKKEGDKLLNERRRIAIEAAEEALAAKRAKAK